MPTYMTSGGPLGGQEVDIKDGVTSVDLEWANDYVKAFKLHYELREADPESGAMQLIYVGRTKA